MKKIPMGAVLGMAAAMEAKRPKVGFLGAVAAAKNRRSRSAEFLTKRAKRNVEKESRRRNRRKR